MFLESFQGGSLRGFDYISFVGDHFVVEVLDAGSNLIGIASQFECPLNGFYKFTLHYDATAGDVSTLAILKGSVQLMSAHTAGVDYPSSASTSVITWCDVGEQVGAVCISSETCSYRETTIFTARLINYSKML